jgi:hypothetical protein
MTASQNPDRRPENHPTTHDTLPPLERRVTLYLGGGLWEREQATWVHVFRWPYAQYADAFRIHFKPRRKRLLRECVDYHGSTVIVAGWNHPDTRPKIIQLNRDEPTLAPSANSVTIGGPPETNMDVIVDRYIRSLPPSDIILDLRGQVVSTGRKW